MLTSIEKKLIIKQILLKNIYPKFLKIINTLNINLNHLITICKPPVCSNSTTHHKSIYPKFLKIINGTKKKKKIIASYFICRKIR